MTTDCNTRLAPRLMTLTTPDAGDDWFWQLDGRNKRSVVLDLKSPEGMEILRHACNLRICFTSVLHAWETGGSH